MIPKRKFTLTIIILIYIIIAFCIGKMAKADAYTGTTMTPYSTYESYVIGKDYVAYRYDENTTIVWIDNIEFNNYTYNMSGTRITLTHDYGGVSNINQSITIKEEVEDSLTLDNRTIMFIRSNVGDLAPQSLEVIQASSDSKYTEYILYSILFITLCSVLKGVFKCYGK